MSASHPERPGGEPSGSAHAAGEPSGSAHAAGEPSGSAHAAGEPSGSAHAAGEPSGSVHAAGEPSGSVASALSVSTGGASVGAAGASSQQVSWPRRGARHVMAYFTERDPTFWNALLPALVIVALVYTRSPATNCIFDEQEALLANPYVNGDHLLWRDAFKRDFWGLPPTGSIGSYRPIPNLIWRALWRLREHPWLPHWVGVMLHAVNAALVSCLALTIAPGHRLFAWLAGLVFVSTAVLTEAVTGVVGIADVLGGMGVLLALLALRLPAYLMPLGVFAALLFGLFSKESVIVAVPLAAWSALVLAPALHPARPRRLLRAVLALGSAVAALVLYTELRRRWFPVALPPELTSPLPEGAPPLKRILHDFMRWFAQPRLPTDPINNPLANADTGDRIAGALRVYARGLGQTLLPLTLSGDYSFPQEPVPTQRYTLASILGGLAMFAAPVIGVLAWVAAWLRERKERRRGLGSGGGQLGGRLSGQRSDGGMGDASQLGGRLSAQLRGGSLSDGNLGSGSLDDASQLGGRLSGQLSGGSLSDGNLGSGSLSGGSALASGGSALTSALASGGSALASGEPSTRHWSAGMTTCLIWAWVLVWVPLAFFPHSNIPVVLPTVRAERFWYLPVVALAFGYAWLLTWVVTRPREALGGYARQAGVGVVCCFIGFQLLSARLHALDYTNDLSFWRATAKSSPNSAKAHLNYSVMLGARGMMAERLVEGERAKELAPQWAMAHVYYGDALCRMKRAEEAWPHYARGFDLKPSDQNLISLALQCLWDQRAWQPHEAELLALADKHPGSWLAHLARDLVTNGEQHGGVNPAYRPRGYNEGPKKK